MIDFVFHYLHLGAHTWGNWMPVGYFCMRRDCGACERFEVRP